ncbi:MAG: TolC family protein [Bacteroidales bacterium]|nr:TolC family protein [Bacteroidales bacterium]
MIQKKKILTLLFVLSLAFSYAQQNRAIRLQECLDQTVLAHPLYEQYQLHQQLTDLKVENLKSDLKPQIALNGKASWQDKVIELPVAIPGITIPGVSKDQYRLSLDLNQALYRGGMNTFQNKMEATNLTLMELATDKEIYAAKSQTKTLFFQIILSDKQKQILQSYQTILDQKIEESRVLVREGLALESMLDVLKLERLKTKQELDQLDLTQKALIKNLNEFTQLNLDEHCSFILPEIDALPEETLNNRFEYRLMQVQQKQVETAKHLLNAKTKPMLFAFATAGFGRPGFNLLSNDFDDFYMLGINLSWKVWDWKKNKNELKLLDIDKDLIETQKESFNLNIQLGLNQLQADIDNQISLLNNDPEIIRLHQNIVNTAEAQFKNGTLSTTDYVVELQKLNQAKLNYEMHRIALVNSKLAYIELVGKL